MRARLRIWSTASSQPKPRTNCGLPTSPTYRRELAFSSCRSCSTYYSRRVVGWAMATHLRTELVLDALDMAIYQRQPNNVIHHSDQGVQYTSIAFGLRCNEAGIRPSMGSVGDCYDNAMCESFNATLECELLDRHRFKNPREAALAVFDFIEGWYNPHRRHTASATSHPQSSSAGVKPPDVQSPTLHETGPASYWSEAGSAQRELLDGVDKIKVLDGPYRGQTGYVVNAVSDPGPGVPADPYVGRNFTCQAPNVNATVTSPVEPVYPPSAQGKGLGAVTVVVEVTIGPTGAVQNAVIYKSSGNADIDASAIHAAQQSTYSPKLFHCKPVTGKFLFRADFQPD